MDSSTVKIPHNEDCVRVAVNIRPLITNELLMGCTDCITVLPGEPQVQIGSHSFTYDYVYGTSASPYSAIYKQCVDPLVESLFQGYNATVLAYGQTGSGKTYTMGTNYTGDDNSNHGIIPQVMDSIFKKVKAMKEDIEFLIRVSFIEILKEEVFDLLDKLAIPARTPIQIRETGNGGISLAGVTEPEVRTKEEMASFLARGSLSRATGSTNMNSQSSRSHAIFTITMEQKRSIKPTSKDETGDDILCAKLHLVDLAGSERAKRTGAGGLRLKEGIHINKGLLALGNVISALGDEKRRKEGGHVPYRDSKLTRLLQDSLGGNSKTIMIACVSPADTNAEETINTLKYANRARNIQNKAVINRDPVTAEMQRMRCQVEQLQAELLCYRSGGAPLEELQVLENRISFLQAKNSELHQRAHIAEVERDKLLFKLDTLRKGKSWNDIDSIEETQEFDLVKSYTCRIQNMEKEIMHLRNLSNSNSTTTNCLDIDIDIDLPQAGNRFLATLHDISPGEIEEEQKELEHSTLQDKLGKELQELDKRLEQKEEEMKLVSKTDTSFLKQHYEKKLLELEHEKKLLQKEIENLRFNLSNFSSTSDDGAKKLKEEYLQKLNGLESQVSELKKKQEAQSQLLRQKQKSDEAAKRLQEEIQRIKSQKVQLQHKIKQESEQFRSWKASREKEVLQLKKEGRRNEYEMHKLLALNQRQKMVLQRKTEEASLATKRLKELLETKKSSREMFGSGNVNERGQETLMQAIEHELEVAIRVHEVRSEYQRQLEARASMANEVSKLKDDNLRKCPSTMSPSARNSRISALENMLATSSTTLVSMASQLSEAEERRASTGRGRWNQVRSLPEAKSLMNHLFNLACSSRCQWRDSEVVCSEKNLVIKELKEKIVLLNMAMRDLEKQRPKTCLQDKAFRKSRCSTKPKKYECSEDMDTSDSEYFEEMGSDDESDEDCFNSGRKVTRKRSRKTPQYPVFEIKGEAHTKTEAIYDESAPDISKPDCKTCSCSKSSSCKTKKCECRSANISCADSCGCTQSKCANREGGGDQVKKEIEELQHEMDEHAPGDRTMALASQGVQLLQSALSEKPPKKDMPLRKPLTEIGNKQEKGNSIKPSKRKKWLKSRAIQLVPNMPPVPSQNENTTHDPPKNNDDVTLKLPRAMGSTVTNINSPSVGEGNSVNTNEPTVDVTRESVGKENCNL